MQLRWEPIKPYHPCNDKLDIGWYMVFPT